MGSETVHALRDVSLNIDRGEYVAIMGPSGSGKSTLMNLLGCLDTPTAGRYELNGTDVSEMDDNDLADVRNREIGFGIVLWDPAVDWPERYGFLIDYWRARRWALDRVPDRFRRFK